MSTFHLAEDLRLDTLVVGELKNTAYKITTRDSSAILIDAPGTPEQIKEFIGDDLLSLILVTHAHHDHLESLAAVAALTNVPPICGAKEMKAAKKATGVECMPLQDKSWVTIGNVRFKLIDVPGHTPGSVAVALELPGSPVHIFGGDALFPGGVGKTHSREEFDLLLDSVTTKFFDVYPDDTVVWPGHGEPTTLGAERPHLGEWRERGW